MGGLYRIFLKLTPIMLLICCICFGISQSFQQPNQEPITYLYTEEINIGTEQEPEYKTLYRFDIKSYTQNIDQNILERSVSKTFDLSAYENTLRRFDEIWENGYNIGDITQTILNGILLIVNTIILPINILLIPIRVTAGILLTGMSLIGININNGKIICPFLTFITDQANIPLINPAHTIETADTLKGKTYEIQNDMRLCYWGTNHTGAIQYYTGYDMYFRFSANNEQYRRLFTTKQITYSAFNYVQKSTVKIWYEDTNGNQILVYDSSNGNWLYNNINIITINNNLDTTNKNLMNQLLYFINSYSTQV